MTQDNIMSKTVKELLKDLKKIIKDYNDIIINFNSVSLEDSTDVKSEEVIEHESAIRVLNHVTIYEMRLREAVSFARADYDIYVSRDSH